MITPTVNYPHLKTDSREYYVTAEWLKYVEIMLRQNSNKFKFGLIMIHQIKSKRTVREGRLSYHPIKFNQFRCLQENLKGNQTYVCTTKH